MDEFLRTVAVPKMAVKSQKGFTIVELLVSMLLTSIIMGAIYSVYRVQTHSAKVQENRLEAQEYARSVLDMMVREIRNAGYNPLSIAATAIGTGCDALGNGAPGVITATGTTFRFTYDFQGAGTPPVNPNSNCNDADEDITYTLSGSDITRTARSSTGGSLTTQNLTNGNVTSFQLQYFKQDGTPAAALADIQRVSISIKVQSKNPDTEFGGQLTVTMTSNADLRNRGLPS